MITKIDKYAKYPALMKVVDLISMQNPLQSKRIDIFLSNRDNRYWEYAENLCKVLSSSFLRTDSEWVEAARSYNRTCMDLLREQIRFRKTRTYLMKDATQANQEIYSRPDVMNYYMVGLLFSYLFWRNHYIILCFFQDYLQNAISIERCLEIAPGHGLFTVEILRRSPDANIMLLDISQTSLEVTGNLLKAFDIDTSHIRSIQGDFLKEPVQEESVDFIVMGEVLEHVNEAKEFMKRALTWLKPGGKLFITTCANCPAFDHVYHFHDVSEIRKLMQDTGFTLIQDIALPAEDVPEDKWQEELVTINYAAIWQKTHIVKKLYEN